MKKYSITVMELLLLTAVLCIGIKKFELFEITEPIRITEICSNNFSVIQDENRKYSDYVELWNGSKREIRLSDYCISDDKEDLEKYSLANITIQPNEYYIFFLDGISENDESQKAFKLSKEGETLYLYNATKQKVVQSIDFPALKYNTVYGWNPKGRGAWSEMSPTPGKANETAKMKKSIQLECPIFSHESGFYEGEFILSLTSPSYEKIYYTLDGSEPTEESYLYRNPIQIQDVSNKKNILAAREDLTPTSSQSYIPNFLVDKATVIKAAAINTRNNTCSETITKIYFVDYEEKEAYRDCAVLALTMSPESLFDKDIGIYTNGKIFEQYKENGGMVNGELLPSYIDSDGNEQFIYEQSNAYMRGKEWEREATLTFFTPEHTIGFSKNVGVRISGGSTRELPQKSMNLYGRNIYDMQETIPYDFFDDRMCESLKLRSGGQNADGVKLKDAFLQSLLGNRNVATQKAYPTAVFLNGEYWGFYDIRERYDKEYLSYYYDVNPDNVLMVSNANAQEGGQEALDTFLALKNDIEQVDVSYDDVYEMVCFNIDIQSFIDFLCINIYLDNEDITFEQNMAVWRTIGEEDITPYGDRKWRWMIFDLDECVQPYDIEKSRGFMKNYTLIQTPFVQNLMNNTQFRKNFVSTMEEMMNTIFQYDRVHESLVKWADRYRTQTVLSNQRFFDKEYSAEKFDEEIQSIDTFFKNRNEFIRQELKTIWND